MSEPMFSYAPKKTAAVERSDGSAPTSEGRGRPGVSNEVAKERLRRATSEGVTGEGGAAPLTEAPKKKVEDTSAVEEEPPTSGGPRKKKAEEASAVEEEPPTSGGPRKKKVDDATTLSGPPKRKADGV